MKTPITEEQIRAEAEMKYNSMAKWEQLAFVEGAKWALSKDSTIEKVKELRDFYQEKIDRFNDLKGRYYNSDADFEIEENSINMVFVSKLNAIIEQ